VRRGTFFQQGFTGLRPAAGLASVRRVTASSALAGVVALSACTPAHGTVGAVLGQRPDGRLFVREAPPELAAAKHGLEPDDEILLVDGKDVRAMDEATLQRTLAGDVGTPVKITAVRGDEIVRVTLRRTPARRSSRAARGDWRRD
jgi:C-terminal processing protease CtpA/Prc